MGTLWIGRVRPMAENGYEEAEAIYVEDGMIQAVGREADLRVVYQNQISHIQDIRPHTIFPGFIDSHLHLMGLGLNLSRLDLTTAHSSEEVARQVAGVVQTLPVGRWVIGEGWNENEWDDRTLMDRQALDEVAPHHPVSLTRICRHAVLVNSRALSLAGIHAETPDPPGGVIVRDATGEPTGLLLDQAQNLITQVLPDVSTETLIQAGHRAMDHLTSLGLVGGHTEDLAYYGQLRKPVEAYQTILKTRRFRTHLLVHHEVVDQLEEMGILPLSVIGDLSFGAMKIFSDGAYGGRTALLRTPYNDATETNGVAIHTQAELTALVEKARQYNMPVAIHAIGDQAFDLALTAIETHPNQSRLPDRLIHGQLVPQDLRHRLLQTDAMIDIQPLFVSSDFPWVLERLGEERMEDAYAWQTLLREGIPCAGGSDAPIESASPILGIYAAVARKKPEERHNGYYPEQKLSIQQAIELYTKGSAGAVGQDAQTGQIRPGFWADFTILDQDLLTIDTESIPETKIIMTVIDNNVVYQNKEAVQKS